MINQGTIAADGSGGGAAGTITINPTTFTDQGSLEVENGETLYVSGSVSIDRYESLLVLLISTLEIGW